MNNTIPFICLITIGLTNCIYTPNVSAESINKDNGVLNIESKVSNQDKNRLSLTKTLDKINQQRTEAGELLYPYGHSQPTIECAPLHVCVIHLMENEKISNLSLGDTVRWIIQTGQAGHRAVVMIKPTEDKLNTNLVITTTLGRIYYLNLISTSNHYLPMVGFYDPDEIIQHVLDQQEKITEQKKEAIATLPSVNPQDIDFNYWCDGADPLPERVFSSLGKVFIQLPKEWIEGKAPVLFIVENGKEVLTNYEINHHYYVVNHLFKEAHLVLGSGDNQQIITIHSGKRPYFGNLFN
ncbi:TrbG/VirB9 family P-type conjugative transfer protein [Ferrovum sp. PN-J185]|uniref:TrbG/VirB9 family P-type conjugative transfer protein n=1 Tax=Ferrovum sp. PN-J185 TaxID=1356306 RepID=UPI00079C0AE4|nr:TrbG/VirB9 family P-type conjugative transfer protein [Ferrovum sp. PN-J185]KXW56458.1 conjugal transfer protein [Ferrovum sp. PN-J185]MCC6068193.1 TrbG/VirB9 family P-type conjugative transfer protein [Ferrovum sp. PN-J185]MDE1891694.1 TrbG/VirB9 family P-type conjugative transfer protein [Betaproteobacteria bacterium]MDE2056464.1 TrbG/VirB9 family P-type conjugative transfer protein [Betaproteobacteria bacterium]